MRFINGLACGIWAANSFIAVLNNDLSHALVSLLLSMGFGAIALYAGGKDSQQ